MNDGACKWVACEWNDSLLLPMVQVSLFSSLVDRNTILFVVLQLFLLNINQYVLIPPHDISTVQPVVDILLPMCV